MGQNATTPQGRNSGTVISDSNLDARCYKETLKLQICQKKSTFVGLMLKISRKFERTGLGGLKAVGGFEISDLAPPKGPKSFY